MNGEESVPPEAPAVPEPKLTDGTSIKELIASAFFVADSAGESEVTSVNPNQVSVLYPLDGSMVTIKLEARSGRWGGVTPVVPLDDEGKKAANQAFDTQKKMADDALATAQQHAQQQ